MPNKIKFHIDENNVAVLTLNDPERLNALSLEMLTEIHEQIKLINADKTSARCLVTVSYTHLTLPTILLV